MQLEKLLLQIASAIELSMPERAVILLAEDREDDILLMQRAFQKALISNPLRVVRRGEEAVAYLKGEGRYSNREECPLPALVLLDLNMPGLDGFQVLEWIRQQPGLSLLRVVILTTSDQMRDVNAAYKLGANSFMVKPVEFGEFVQMLKLLTTYWLEMSKAPETSRLSQVHHSAAT